MNHSSCAITQFQQLLSKLPHFSLTQLPTPVHRLTNFGKHIDCAELWIKRDDLSGLAGGGNKTRKLEFLIADALAKADPDRVAANTDAVPAPAMVGAAA